MSEPGPEHRGPAGPPRRVVVTSPRMRTPRRTAAHRVSHDIDAQTRLGEVYMASLVRSQLRLAVLTCSMLLVAVGALPLVFWLAPPDASPLGTWLPWVVLGLLVYPFLVAVAWWHVRHAERNEREFVELVDRS